MRPLRKEHVRRNSSAGHDVRQAPDVGGVGRTDVRRGREDARARVVEQPPRWANRGQRRPGRLDGTARRTWRAPRPSAWGHGTRTQGAATELRDARSSADRRGSFSSSEDQAAREASPPRAPRPTPAGREGESVRQPGPDASALRTSTARWPPTVAPTRPFGVQPPTAGLTPRDRPGTTRAQRGQPPARCSAPSATTMARAVVQFRVGDDSQVAGAGSRRLDLRHHQRHFIVHRNAPELSTTHAPRAARDRPPTRENLVRHVEHRPLHAVETRRPWSAPTTDLRRHAQGKATEGRPGPDAISRNSPHGAGADPRALGEDRRQHGCRQAPVAPTTATVGCARSQGLL